MNFSSQIDSLVDLERAKRLFLIFAAVCLTAILPDGFYVYLQKPKEHHKNLPISKKPILLEPVNSYLETFDRNTLFGSSASGGSISTFQVSATELIKDYRLKGVVLGGDPEAIVEDAKTQKTLFLKTGEQLGELIVKEIKEGMIVLSYPGGEAKLEIQ